MFWITFLFALVISSYSVLIITLIRVIEIFPKAVVFAAGYLATPVEKSHGEESPSPHIVLGAVGDIIIHKELQELAFKSNFWHRQSYAEIWKEAIPLLQFPDLLYGNLEGIVSTTR